MPAANLINLTNQLSTQQPRRRRCPPFESSDSTPRPRNLQGASSPTVSHERASQTSSLQRMRHAHPRFSTHDRKPPSHHRPEQPITTLTLFLSTLPTIPLSSLSSDSKHCTICQETFLPNHSSQSTYSTPNESPISLPCNHVFGSSCIATWLSTPTSGGKCPLCRVTLYEPDPVLDEALSAPPGPSSLSESVRFLSRLVATDADFAAVIRDAQQMTRARVERARQHRSLDSLRSSFDFNTLPQQTPFQQSPSASQILQRYQNLTTLDLRGEELNITAWETLARETRSLRSWWSGFIDEDEVIGVLGRHGPGVGTLLNPIFRPLVVELLEKLVEWEREIREGREALEELRETIRDYERESGMNFSEGRMW